MDTNLIKVRLVAFGYEAGSLLLTAILGVLVSSDFSQLVTEHFGMGVLASVILLGISAGVKHLRNLRVLKKFSLGSTSDQEPPVLI